MDEATVRAMLEQHFEHASANGRRCQPPSPPWEPVPSAWSEPKAPIVGVEAMHETLRRWLTESGLEVRPHASG